MLTPGTFKGIVAATEWTKASTGTPGLAVTVNIPDEFGVEQLIVGTIWISKKAAGMARGQFHALGVDPDADDIREIGETISLVGREVEVSLKEEEYKGKVNLKVERFGSWKTAPTKTDLAKAQQWLWEARDADGNQEPSKPPVACPPKPPAPKTMAEIHQYADELLSRPRQPQTLPDENGTETPF